MATSRRLFRLALSACSSSLGKVDVEGVEAEVSLCVFGYRVYFINVIFNARYFTYIALFQ